MRHVSDNIVSVKVLRVFMAALSLLGAGLLLFQPVFAQEALSRSLIIGSSVPDDVTTYRLGFTVATAGALGSIKLEFCENSPLLADTCDPPAGFDISSATLLSESGETGFNIDALTTANSLLLSRTPAVSAGGVQVAYELGNVHNASAPGTSYARISTYATSDGSGPISDEGGLAYSLNPAFAVSAEVPPYIIMCVGVSITGTDCLTASGDYVNMGDFSPNAPRTGSTQIVLATNAANGYIINVSGNTMTSGNNVIPNLASPTVSVPGVSQFGINLRANSSPSSGVDPSGGGSGSPAPDYNIPNRYTYRPGDIIASFNNVENYRKYTITFLVNVSRTQAPGIYSSTYTFIGLGNF
jgi:hypothetical protein